MKFNYYAETDTLYIVFNEAAGTDSFEISKDFVVDVDSKGQVLGLEVLNVKDKINFDQIIFNQFPVKDISFVNQ